MDEQQEQDIHIICKDAFSTLYETIIAFTHDRGSVARQLFTLQVHFTTLLCHKLCHVRSCRPEYLHCLDMSQPSSHSPMNVVAWHGNYLPYKYNLQCFCAINSVTYDHVDPSIYAVLTCPSHHPGTALADFVIFPPRIMATDSNTLRPPWFHRNTMSEYMGLIHGCYDAKEGFVAGGASLHNCMTPHGPDYTTYSKAVADECTEPSRFAGGLAFMFETCLSLKVAPTALYDLIWRDVNYTTCWQPLEDQFTGWHLLQQQRSESDGTAETGR